MPDFDGIPMWARVQTRFDQRREPQAGAAPAPPIAVGTVDPRCSYCQLEHGNHEDWCVYAIISHGTPAPINVTVEPAGVSPVDETRPYTESHARDAAGRVTGAPKKYTPPTRSKGRKFK